MTHYGPGMGTFQICQAQLIFSLASSEARVYSQACAGHFGTLVCPALYPQVLDSHWIFILSSGTEKYL